MTKPSLETLGLLVAENRRKASAGVRAAAAEIGISPATLSRIESGRLPDLETFRRICEWLGIDPGEVLGSRTASPHSTKEDTPAVYGVHFRKPDAVSPKTAKALAELILAATRAMAVQEDLRTED